MNNWHSGYVVDVGYTYGFYRELAPSHLSFIASLAGTLERDITHYCELGCGQGLTANLLAAANPDVDFWAMDFNPAQIRGAQKLASMANIRNVEFLEASFSEFLKRVDLPLFDVIALHGIYSWVGSEHRDTIVEILRTRLRPGGLVYISYNALPGWTAAAPLRELLYRYGRQGQGSERISDALAFAERLEQIGGRYFKANPSAGPRLAQLKTQNSNYLAHEYLNAAWQCFYHAEVVEQLTNAKLDFIASADVLDHVEVINLTSEQQSLLQEILDPALRETTRDYLVNRQFRRDVFVRGKLLPSKLEAQESLRSVRVALTLLRSEIPKTVKGVLGEASLQPKVYDPLLEVLTEGPCTLGKLITDKRLAGIEWGALQQAVTVLIGAGHLTPCLPAEGEAARAKSTRTFNLTVLERARYGEELQYLASPVTGNGHLVPRIEQLFLVHRQSKVKESPESFVWQILAAQNQRVLKDGVTIQSDAENLDELRDRHAAFLEKRLPVLQQLGIA